MAKRPVFVAKIESLRVETILIDFTWYPGYSILQKQKSISDFHEKARSKGIENILEISSKSSIPLGVALSSFNLKTKAVKSGREFSVESAFQGSKVFERGGPYSDLIFGESRLAKKDPRIKSSGSLTEFNFMGIRFPLKPMSFFYDWLYVNTLLKNNNLFQAIERFSAFTDIEFNPNKSINCQAFSLALFQVLYKNNLLQKNKISPEDFLELTKEIYNKTERRFNVQEKISIV